MVVAGLLRDFEDPVAAQTQIDSPANDVLASGIALPPSGQIVAGFETNCEKEGLKESPKFIALARLLLLYRFFYRFSYRVSLQILESGFRVFWSRDWR